MSLGVMIGRAAGAPARLFSARPRALEIVTVALLLLLLVMAVFGDALAPYDPYRVDLAIAHQAPSAAHWLGTDENGRDILSRLLSGAGSTLRSAVLIGVAAAAIGVAVAAIATAFGGWIDEVIMRICDILLAIPSLILALGIAVALGPSLESAVIAMIIAGWPGATRVVRGVMRTTMRNTYVESARAMGASRGRIMVTHVIPNSLDVVIVQTAFDIGGTTLLLASLSYVGVGAQPPSAEWGSMAAEGGAYALSYWWIALWPGLAITLAVVTFGLLGEILQTRLNPALRGGR